MRSDACAGVLRRGAVLLAMICCAACQLREPHAAGPPDAVVPTPDEQPLGVRPDNLDGEIIEGHGFRHRVLRNAAASGWAAAASAGEYRSALHIYIEGDGVPGSRSGRAARDPTSPTALMPRLMRVDPAASIYLGRPCYDGLAGDPGCNAHLWTDARFSVAVVASMGRAIEAEMERAATRSVVLIGYSGGGTLAVLLAQRLPMVEGIITLGANLDTTAWTTLHGYAPLHASLNPAAWGRRLPDSVKAFHWVGSDDRVIPPWLLERAAATVGGQVIVVPGFRHDCCWEGLWPRPLDRLER